MYFSFMEINAIWKDQKCCYLSTFADKFSYFVKYACVKDLTNIMSKLYLSFKSVFCCRNTVDTLLWQGKANDWWREVAPLTRCSLTEYQKRQQLWFSRSWAILCVFVFVFLFVFVFRNIRWEEATALISTWLSRVHRKLGCVCLRVFFNWL